MINTLQNIFIAQKTKQCLIVKVSKTNLNLLKLLREQSLIYSFSKHKEFYYVFLKKNVIKNIKIFSKPGKKIFCNTQDLIKISSINKILLVNTTQGVLLGKEALKNKQGGELLCEIIF
jgi:small subunit ribosomal protein S8